MERRWPLVLIVALIVFAFASEFLPIRCVFKSLTGYPCAGCGLLRSFGAMLHGRWSEALYYNPLTFVLLGYLSILLLAATIDKFFAKQWYRQLTRGKTSSFLLIILFAITLINWVRNIVLGL
ncbi:MAG: DUF2752 domain-containing protein [Porphyromonas sp.]|nr:DUF2752 domain-containing protein [Porphyromonas sp.]